MWNETNPTSLYLGTTWELISADKYVKTGDRALQTGGNNSISIQKANLPNIKLKVDSFSLTTQQHDHPATVYWGDGWNDDHPNGTTFSTAGAGCSNTNTARTGKSGGQNTGTASPSTEALGSGNAITIQPEFITLKFWKRTS
nr:MAG TPA: Baseplate structural protein [Caudoviricetes sp.]